MPTHLRWLSCLALLAVAGGARAQSAVVVTEHVRAELVAHAPNGIAPGAEVWLGLAIQHAPGWHTYWKNPGDSGLPTSLAWQLPTGVAAQDIAWPTPGAIKLGPLTNYGYIDSLLLPVRVRVADGFAADTLSIRLHAEWLVCEENCIPEAGDFLLELPAAQPVVSRAPAFAKALALAPAEPKEVQGAADIVDDQLVVRVDRLPAEFQGQPLQFFPELGGVIDHAAAIEQRWAMERWQARVPLSSQRSESPATLAAVLVAPGRPAGIRVSLAVAWPAAAAAPVDAGAPGTRPTVTPPVAPTDLGSWLLPGLVLLAILVAWAWHRFRRRD